MDGKNFLEICVLTHEFYVNVYISLLTSHGDNFPN